MSEEYIRLNVGNEALLEKGFLFVLFPTWQSKIENTPVARFALHTNFSPQLLYDAPRDRQSQAVT